MIRVMQINQGERFGGVSAMMYQFYEHLDHSQFQYDFVAPGKSSLSQYRDQIVDMGGEIIELGASGNFIVRKLKFWNRLKCLICDRRYQIVHINSGSILFNAQCAWIAKLCHVKKVIVHSHNAGTDGKLRQRLMRCSRFLLEYAATDFWACSNKAAQYMFTKKRIQSGEYYVINNGINTVSFCFRQDIRDKYRKQLDIEEKKVLLHIGRFCPQKNHKFLVKLFKTFLDEHPDSILLMVGEGELLSSVMQYVDELGISDHVIHLKQRNDIPQLMMAADVLILPSLYEGLPVVGVEAQASGLPCLFSSEITREVDIVGENSFISLNSSLQEWCQAIENALQFSIARADCASEIARKGFSIEYNTKEIERLYLE